MHILLFAFVLGALIFGSIRSLSCGYHHLFALELKARIFGSIRSLGYGCTFMRLLWNC